MGVSKGIKAGATLGVAAFAVVGLAACSGSTTSSPSSSSASPTTSSPTSSPTGSDTPYIPASCTTESLLEPLPDGSTMVNFACGSTGDGQIAAVKVNPGPTVFFVQTTGVGGKWQVVDKDSICGTAKAGLPPKVLAFCSA